MRIINLKQVSYGINEFKTKNIDISHSLNVLLSRFVTKDCGKDTKKIPIV